MNQVSLQPHVSQAAPHHGEPRRLGERDELPLVRQYIRMLFRWRFVVAGTIAVCFLSGLVLTFFMTPKYTAVSAVEISRESNNITEIQGVERDASVADQEFYQTQYGLLRARSLAERVAVQLRLVDDGSFFEMFGMKDGAAAFQRANGRYPVSGRAERQRLAGDILLKNIAIDPVRMSRLVNIRFTSPNAAFSARVANAWSANFIQSNLERRYQATSYARTFLESRLAQLRQRLEESERQLVGYASNQQIINLPAGDGQGGANGQHTVERSIVADNLAALNTALSQATADRVQAQARYQQGGGNGANSEALQNAAINSLRQRRAELAAEYQRLMVQFGPEWEPARMIKSQVDQLDRGIAREEARVSGSLASGYKEAVGRERDLTARVEVLKTSYLDQRRRSIQYNIFQREVDTNRQLYDGLLQRYKEIGVAGGVGVNNVSVVDPADVPDRPSSPRVFLNLILALVGGTVLGVGLAFVLDHVDEAIADPAEVERQFGLPLLGSIPKMVGSEPVEALQDRKSELVDAYLAVQSNLEFSTSHGVPRSLAVTSTRPAEGKSTTAMALATMLSRARRRVVLVDGDMRSPSVHYLVGVDHDRGLSNYLAGSDDIAPLLLDMPTLGFAVMTAGPIPPNAAELLTGDRLSQLIEHLLTQFDHVVIDSPPVMGLADAPLIASRVEGVVYAIEAHGIRTSLVRTALARLASANARVIGGVLTKFESNKAHYGYGYDYGYGYGDQQARAGARSH